MSKYIHIYTCTQTHTHTHTDIRRPYSGNTDGHTDRQTNKANTMQDTGTVRQGLKEKHPNTNAIAYPSI